MFLNYTQVSSRDKGSSHSEMNKKYKLYPIYQRQSLSLIIALSGIKTNYIIHISITRTRNTC